MPPERNHAGWAARTVRWANRPALLWLVLSVPGGYWIVGFGQGWMYYGEFLHATGELAARLLILTMAVTPLGLLFGRRPWTRWLARNRRGFGVATFAYAALHALAYLLRQPLDRVIDEAAHIGMLTGWIALTILLLQAVTSNDLAVRLLQRRWKWLHRAVYLAAALTFAHWVLTAFDPLSGYVHVGVLVILEACRLWFPRRRQAAS